MWNYHHVDPRRVWKGGCMQHLMTPLQLDQWDQLDQRDQLRVPPRLDFEQPSIHFGPFARKMDPRISENGPQNHPKVHLRLCNTQARGQRNLEAQKGPPPRCFLVVTCTIWLRFPFWRRGSDRVAAARLFQGSKPPKIVPNKVHFQEVQTLKNRSQKVHFT